MHLFCNSSLKKQYRLLVFNKLCMKLFHPIPNRNIYLTLTFFGVVAIFSRQKQYLDRTSKRRSSGRLGRTQTNTHTNNYRGTKYAKQNSWDQLLYIIYKYRTLFNHIICMQLQRGRGQSQIPSLIWILESEVFTLIKILESKIHNWVE